MLGDPWFRALAAAGIDPGTQDTIASSFDGDLPDQCATIPAEQSEFSGLALSVPAAQPYLDGPSLSPLNAGDRSITELFEDVADHSTGSWLPLSQLEEFFGFAAKSLEKTLLKHGFTSAETKVEN